MDELKANKKFTDFKNENFGQGSWLAETELKKAFMAGYRIGHADGGADATKRTSPEPEPPEAA